MKILELYQKGFDTAVEELMKEHGEITTYDKLKELAINKLNEDNLIVALHILQALEDCYANYYKYDSNMGTLSCIKPLFEEPDLEEFCDGRSFTADAHIHSLDGSMDEITVLEERQAGNRKYYIVKYKDIFCTAIFNGFTCSYYADDKYGRME